MSIDHPEVSIRELRANLAGIVHRAAVRREVVYVTSRGRRIAIVAPLPDQQTVDQLRAQE